VKVLELFPPHNMKEGMWEGGGVLEIHYHQFLTSVLVGVVSFTLPAVLPLTVLSTY
jgi:hypothetical protein